MNIALAFPQLNNPSGDPPLGLGYLAANLPPSFGARVTLVDGTFMKSEEEFDARLAAARPDIVGIYFDTMGYGRRVAAAKRARAMGAFVVAGAALTSDLPPYGVAVGSPARVIRQL